MEDAYPMCDPAGKDFTVWNLKVRRNTQSHG